MAIKKRFSVILNSSLCSFLFLFHFSSIFEMSPDMKQSGGKQMEWSWAKGSVFNGMLFLSKHVRTKFLIKSPTGACLRFALAGNGGRRWRGPRDVFDAQNKYLLTNGAVDALCDSYKEGNSCASDSLQMVLLECA